MASSTGDAVPNAAPMSFVSEVPQQEVEALKRSIDQFVILHATNHRPIVLVSSGGTACDLEVNSVRCLDNFSTGLRGAVCVEEFLKRGYAVVHLWRAGSASPFARVLTQSLGITPANHSINIDSLGLLFATDIDQEEEYVKTVLQQDPFLSEPAENFDASPPAPSARDEIHLHRSIQHSTRLRRALSERAIVLNEGRLLTIPFRTVEEYLCRLELASQSLNDCQSLVLFFLAAAVSDYYVPRAERSLHKIQSNEQELTLRLQPVPKTIGLLRRCWAPYGFVVSFKLETDPTVLRQKAERAVGRYGCHLVVGNLLQSRHDKVWILQPPNQRDLTPSDASQWELVEIAKPIADDPDALEAKLVDSVAQAHFEYISWHFHADGSGVKAVAEARARLDERMRQVHRAQMWRNMQGLLVECAGVGLALVLSYSINTVLQRRLRGA